MPIEYPIIDIKITKFDAINNDLVSVFDCGTNDLNDFLKDDALNQMKESVNITYLWISKKRNKVISYITVCNDSIHLSGNKKEEMKKIGIAYKALPALKICRMAVDQKFARKKLGSKMIFFAGSLVKNINQFSACRFMTLEAKNNSLLMEVEKPIHFYKKLGFVITRERRKNSSYIPMYKDLQLSLKGI